LPFGNNRYGELGVINNQNIFSTSVFGENFKLVAGSGVTYAITDSGIVFAWGSNEYGELGLGNNIKQSTPQKLIFKSHQKIRQIATGTTSCIALVHC